MAYSAMQFAEAARDTANPEHLCRNSRPVQHMLCILRCTENGWIALSRRLWQSARGGGEGGRGGRPAGESGGGGGERDGSVMQNKGIWHQPEPMEMALVKAHSAMLP